MADKPVTNQDAKLYICATPQTATPLTQSAFEALTWLEIGNVGTVDGMGTSTNTVSYNALNTKVTQKGKGITNGGDWTVEVARIHTDPGQIALRAAALTKHDYAFKYEDNDAPPGFTNTITYNCGLVNGPTRGSGRVEDFVLNIFTVACNQLDVIVEPEEI
ncbi:hypothetical protein ACLBXM_20090 [Xanthobacteraceae bacterium A53D]